MTRDWSNRSFSEMAHSTGDETISPFELPLQPVPVNRTDDRNTRYPSGGTSYNGGTTRSPFEIPVQGGRTTTQQPGTDFNSGSPYNRTAPNDPRNGQWRATPDVAPTARNLPPLDGQQPTYTQQPNNGQWRATPDIAPSARQLPPLDGQQPTYTQGGDGQWRAQPNVAPGARQLPPLDGSGGGQYNPNDPGRWQPSPNQLPGTDGNGRYTVPNGQQYNPGGGQQYQPGGGQIGSDPVATTGNGGISQANDAQRQAVNNSLHTQLNYFTHFAEGAIGGLAGSSVIPWASDKLFFSKFGENTPVFRQVGNWWKNNHSPRQFEYEAAMADANALVSKGGMEDALRVRYQDALKEKMEAGTAWDAARRTGDTAAIQKAAAEFRAKNAAVLRLESEPEYKTELERIKAQTLESGQVGSLTRQLLDSRASASTAYREMIGRPSAAGRPASGYMELVELTRKTQQDLAAAKAAATPDADLIAALEKKSTFLQTSVLDTRHTLGVGTTADVLRSDISAHKAAGVITAEEAAKMQSQLDRFLNYQAARRTVTAAEGEILKNGGSIADAKAAAELVKTEGGAFKWTGTQNTWQRTTQAAEGAVPAAGEPKVGWAEKELGTWRGDNKWRAMGEGVGVVATGLAVNYLVDRGMDKLGIGGGDVHPGDHWRSYLQGPAMAASLIFPNNFVKKVGYTALSVGLITATEHFFPEKPNSTYSAVMKPNWMDSLGMGAAWMLPFTNWKSRAMAVGGAWALGRGLNIVDSTFGTHLGGSDHNYAVGMDHDVASSLISNKVSEGSFDDIRSRSVKLGMENEGALLVQQGDFMNNKDHDPLYHLHGSAALFTAWGDIYMQRGTKVDPSKTNADGRILTGSGYDLGGQATDFYRQAMANLVEGQNQAARAGQKDQQDAMAKSQREVMDRLNKIYGEHDVNDVFNKLKEEYRQNIDSIPRYQIRLKGQVDSLQTRDTQYAAKMCRDLALLDLAIASYKADHNEGGGAQIMYAEALKYLQAAERIDAKAPDAKKLRQIADGMSRQIPQAVNNQFNNGFNNPFGVK